MPLEWPTDGSADRPRRQKKTKKKGSGGSSNNGTTVGLALLFALPALSFFGALGYCLWMKVVA